MSVRPQQPEENNSCILLPTAAGLNPWWNFLVLLQRPSNWRPQFKKKKCCGSRRSGVVVGDGCFAGCNNNWASWSFVGEMKTEEWGQSHPEQKQGDWKKEARSLNETTVWSESTYWQRNPFDFCEKTFSGRTHTSVRTVGLLYHNCLSVCLSVMISSTLLRCCPSTLWAVISAVYSVQPSPLFPAFGY